MIRKILIATDFSATANHLIEFALPLAEALGCEVHVLHVDEESAVYGLHDHHQAVAFLEDIGVRRDQWLAELAAGIEATGLRCVCARRTGFASVEIVAYAEQNDIDLVVIGKVGQTRLAPMLSGSTFKQAARHLTTSLLSATLDSRLRSEAPLISRILCPVDFSESSRQAAGLAAWLAARFNAKLDLLHVLQLPAALLAGPGEPPLSLPPHVIDAMERRFDEQLAEIADALPLERVRYGIERGQDTAEVICQRAQVKNADLIVLPRVGEGGLRAMLLGRVVEDVLALAPVPVLMVAPERMAAMLARESDEPLAAAKPAAAVPDSEAVPSPEWPEELREEEAEPITAAAPQALAADPSDPPSPQ